MPVLADRRDRTTELEIVAAFGASEIPAKGIAERDVVARHFLIANDVGTGHERCTECEVLGQRI